MARLLNTTDIINLARAHAHEGAMTSSARLNLSEANDAYDRGHYGAARISAIRSLKYSVGILHTDYERAQTADKRLTEKELSRYDV